MKRLAFLILLGLLVSQTAALEINHVLWDRAFSPNDDGVQDRMPLSFLVDADEDDLLEVRALIARSSDTPPSEEDWVEVLVDLSEDLSTFQNIFSEWDGLDESELPYVDGFYFLHLYARSENDELWMDPVGEIEINTIAPSFLSVAVEPQPFTPLMAGADTVQQVFFTSEDFDTLTDSGKLEILAFSEDVELWYTVNILTRDPGYAQFTGQGVRYRFLWDGTDNLGNRNDGLYPAIITLEDDAGNSVEGQVSLDLDIEAPTLSVLGRGGWPEGELRYDFNPDALPDSLWIHAEDRHGVDSCQVAWGVDAPFDTQGIAQDSGELEFEDYLFLIPSHWTADSTYKIVVDVRDGPGHWLSELSSEMTITVKLDGEAPLAPEWHTHSGERIQGFHTIKGAISEVGLEVRLYKNGDATAVDTTEASGGVDFSFIVELDEGEQSYTLQTFDDAGNPSEISEALNMVYSPGAAIIMPGRFRDSTDESIQVNTPSDAERVEIRFFSLDGAELRVLDANGGPQEWSVSWDRLDSNGRRPAPGLLIALVRSYLESGEILEDRKVVALVE
jgi:hypothetical protein